VADIVRIISADSHVDIQQDRVLANLPEKYHDGFKAGQMAALQKMMEQKPHKMRQQAKSQEEAAPSGGFLAGAGSRELPWEAAGRPGAYDPVARLADMDIDQVEAEVLYTDVQGGASFYEQEDVDATLATFEAWNTAAVEFCSNDPKRLLAVYLVPIHDIDAGVKEIKRLGEEGARAIQLPLYPLDLGFLPYWDKVYDPLWEAIAERNMTISQHVGIMSYLLEGMGVHDPTPVKGIMQSLPPIFMSESLAGWLVSGVLERHPDLKVVLVEAGLGWIPYMLDRLDRMVHRHGWDHFDMPIKELPSFYWKRNMAATFEEDELGISLRDHIGIENLLWATDYPHPDSTWPESQQVIRDHFKDIDVEDMRAIVGGNAARMYGL
jgi:predicted TIM-barrel fold metal-dependent hydrolase